jgi:sporulation protein YqfC
MSQKVLQRVASALDLPHDIVLNIPRITLTGKIAVFLENHKGIVEYCRDTVRINTPIGIIVIKGEDLLIKTIIADEITVEGNVRSVEFEE